MRFKTKKMLFATILVFGFLFGICFLCLGFHNIDLVYNFHNAGGDCNEVGCVSIQALYFRGATMLLTGVVFNIVSAIFSILLIMSLMLDTHSEPIKNNQHKPKAIILDDNALSILSYAEEYPENWKKICDAVDKEKEKK